MNVFAPMYDKGSGVHKNRRLKMKTQLWLSNVWQLLEIHGYDYLDHDEAARRVKIAIILCIRGHLCWCVYDTRRKRCVHNFFGWFWYAMSLNTTSWIKEVKTEKKGHGVAEEHREMLLLTRLLWQEQNKIGKHRMGRERDM